MQFKQCHGICKVLWGLRKNNSFSCKCGKEASEKRVLMLKLRKSLHAWKKREGHFKLGNLMLRDVKTGKMEGKARTRRPACWPRRVFRESSQLRVVRKENRVTKGLISSHKQPGQLSCVLHMRTERKRAAPLVGCCLKSVALVLALSYSIWSENLTPVQRNWLI